VDGVFFFVDPVGGSGMLWVVVDESVLQVRSLKVVGITF